MTKDGIVQDVANLIGRQNAAKALVESWIERERGYHEKILEMRRQEKSSTIYEVWLMATQLHRWELQEAAGLPSTIDTPGVQPIALYCGGAK